MLILVSCLISFAFGQAIILDLDKYENKTRIVRKVGEQNEI
jgi:hypothetical protein